jgi:DNA-binding response OmpR family regulator
MPQQIMVVDDEQGMLKLISLLLESIGFQVLKTTSAFDALDMLKESTPDLFILDVMMPEVDGIELCRQIRVRHQTMHTPVLMLSARYETNIVEEAFEAGANDYLSKPILPHDLRAAVHAHLEIVPTS